MDYGFHAPTMSFPIAGTLMVEPTESESKAELDRFCEAMIAIRAEIRDVEEGKLPRDDNPAQARAAHGRGRSPRATWTHPYSREIGRVPRELDAGAQVLAERSGGSTTPHGDRNLMCTCPPIEAYSSRESS